MTPWNHWPAIRTAGGVAVRACGLGTLALVALFAAPGPSRATTAPVSPAPAPACAWPTAVTVATDNVGGPDSNAGYWLQPFTVQSTLRIVIAGRYPDARYASLNVYTSSAALFTLHGVGAALADYQIAPDPGSVNPWQKRAQPGGHFTVMLRADIVPHQVNKLPLAPAGTANGSLGYLLYRVYLPAGGHFASVTLPTLTLVQGRTSHTLRPCAHPSPPGRSGAIMPSSGGRAAPTPTRPPTGTAARLTPLKFYRPTLTGGLPDADGAYLIASLFPPGPADVMVVTAKAPRAPSGSHPTPWPASGDDMRYWSLCNIVYSGRAPVVANPLPGGSTDYGCRADDATRLDAAGYYFFVLGRESQRAAIARIPGVTFLPFSSAQPTAPNLLLLRNKLVTPGFAYAIQKIAQDRNPVAAAAATGPYYPRAAVCPLRALIARGPQACLPHP